MIAFLLNLLFHIISILSIGYLALITFDPLFKAGKKDKDEFGMILGVIFGKIIYFFITVATYCNPTEFYKLFLNSKFGTTEINWVVLLLFVVFGFISHVFIGIFLNTHNIVARRFTISFVTIIILFLGHSYITIFSLNIPSNININLGLLPFLSITTGFLIFWMLDPEAHNF